MNSLHKLAEHADWYRWPPRKLWRRLLAWCDRRWTTRPSKANDVAATDRIHPDKPPKPPGREFA